MIEIDISTQPAWGADNWQALCEQAVNAALGASPYPGLTSASAVICFSVCFADNAEVQALNRDYRGKDNATNILSFPMVERNQLNLIAGGDCAEILLGDMILAHGICAAEAADKAISLANHVSHLIIHGTLHLLGYDHIEDGEADAMEAMEVKALASMALPNPYSDQQ